MKTNLDISKPVKFVDPQIGEENLIFRVTNYNDVTNRIIIVCTNSRLSLPGHSLVHISDVINL